MNFLYGLEYIVVIYAAIALIVSIIFLRLRKVDNLLQRLDQRQITRGQRQFGLNYGVLAGLLVVIAVSLLVIARKDLRGDQAFFTFFGFFAFIAMPLALGWLSVYPGIVRRGSYRVGDGLLLLIAGSMFAMYGVNLHDVLWCGVATDWFSREVIGGYDLAQYFVFWGVTDENLWDYRVFGILIGCRALLELWIGVLALGKYKKMVLSPRRSIILPFALLLITSTVFGLVEFAFDSPWFFTDLEYYLILFAGIGFVGALYTIAGLKIPPHPLN